MRHLPAAFALLLAACGSRTSPLVELPDASAAPDAGRGRDAGPPSIDAGGPLDAGPRPDAGPPRPPTTLTAGAWFTCAADSAGALHCWGRNDETQLGDGTSEDRASPVPVTNGLDGELVQISAGSGYVCGVDRGGDVWCWGRRIGNYDLALQTPVQIPNVRDAVHVEAGPTTACALHADGGVSCWGSTYMQRGGECRTPGTRRPSRVEGAEGAVQIAVGAGSHCLRRGDGTVHCWGCNARGKLGIGDGGGTFEEPIQVEGLERTVDLSLGWNHSCAVRGDGRSFCWGSAVGGGLGNGETRGSFSTPQPTTLPRADAIFAGDWALTCALVDGEVHCVGALPVEATPGSCGGRAEPEWTRQLGLPPIERMSVSFGSDLCARAADDRSVWCWGCNAFGGVGDGTATLTETPAQVLR